MTFLVFGETGQVASELGLLEDVVTLGRATADLSVPEQCARLIRLHRPDAVINAAAYTAVDKAESEPKIAHVVNAVAPGEMAASCAGLGIPFVHISTDYVFDGSGHAPWKPDDPVAPLGVYGTSKRAGEEAILAIGGDAVILRTSWVFSSHGTNFVKTMLRLGRERDRLTIVADQIGGPTPARAIAAACHRIAKARTTGEGRPGIYHFSGQPDTNWADFAREIFALSRVDVAVENIPTSAYPTPARRPANSRLDCTSLTREFGIAQPDWRIGLRDTLIELGQLNNGEFTA